MTRRYAIEIVNIDEDMAEKAVQEAVRAIADVCPQVRYQSLRVEPHDDARGVFCGVDVDPHDIPSANLTKLLLDTLKHMTALAVYPARPKIYIHTTEDKN